MFVIPAEGLKVRRPTKPYSLLPDSGAEVNETEAGFYWHQRLAQGDVRLETDTESSQRKKLAQEEAEASVKAELARAAAAEKTEAEAAAAKGIPTLTGEGAPVGADAHAAEPTETHKPDTGAAE
jgi:hypothetical protein